MLYLDFSFHNFYLLIVYLGWFFIFFMLICIIQTRFSGWQLFSNWFSSSSIRILDCLQQYFQIKMINIFYGFPIFFYLSIILLLLYLFYIFLFAFFKHVLVEDNCSLILISLIGFLSLDITIIISNMFEPPKYITTPMF